MMKLFDFLIEMPVTGWNSDPDMKTREQVMMSRFTGNPNDKVHYDAADKSTIKAPERVIQNFTKSPYPFNIYFHQLDHPDYDPYLQKGLVDKEWLIDHGINLSYQPNSINIVITNNLSDERKISFKSPWIIAHRIGHALDGQSQQLVYKFKEFIFKIATTGYDIYWSSHEDDFGMYEEMFDIYSQVFGHHLGTMRSARNQHLTGSDEWAIETFAQYIMTGSITINPLPHQLSTGEIITHDPKKLKKIERLMVDFPKILMSYFHRILSRSVGEIYVV